MIDADISLKNGKYDLTLEKGDLKIDNTFKTPFLTSLYTNSKKKSSHGLNSVGGYWANSLKKEEQGSLLWTYNKARKNEKTAQEIKDICRNSLLWTNKNIELKYKVKKDTIIISFLVEGNKEDFNFEEIF